MRKNLVLLLCIILTLAALTSPVAVTADSTVDSGGVTEKQAREVASYYVKGYAKTIDDWQGAVIGEAKEYYTDDKISAYEFEVLNGEEGAGYILISARKDWMPVLEFGTGNPPSSRLAEARAVASESGYAGQVEESEIRYYYGGATRCRFFYNYGKGTLARIPPFLHSTIFQPLKIFRKSLEFWGNFLLTYVHKDTILLP